MSLNHITRACLAMLVAVAAAQLLDTTSASAGIFGTKAFDQTGCKGRCPQCNHVCRLDVKEGEQDKKCFEVEKKVICIPRVVFPWQKKPSCGSCDSCDGGGCNSCIHNGAKVREVKILKTKKYKCPKCEYSWSAEKSPCGSGCCDSGCCDAGVSGDAGAGSDTATMPPESVPYSASDAPGLEPVHVFQYGLSLPIQ